MAKVEKVPTADFNPFYGCFIMFMAGLIFLGIIAWSAWSLLSQDKAIAQFAADQPITLPTIDFPDSKRADLESRLTSFAKAATSGQKASLSLTIVDLNGLLLLAPDSGYGSYQNMIRFDRFVPDKNQVVGKVSLPMNHIKFWENKKRYLNGEASLEIFLHDLGVDARVAAVNVPGKVVAEGFVSGMGAWTWLASYQKMDIFGPVLRAVKKVTVTPSAVVLETQP
jgi:hypothetical protein